MDLLFALDGNISASPRRSPPLELLATMKFRNVVGSLPNAVTHGLLLLSGTTLSQAIPALLAPALTRIYSPADFGVFAITFAILGVLAPIVCLRYDVAVLLPESEDKAARLILLCVALAISIAVLSILGCTLFWLFAPTPSAAAFSAPLIATIPIGVLLLGLQKVGQSWALRLKDFKIQSTALLAQASVSIGSQVAMGLVLGSNPFFLIIGAQLGVLASVLILIVALRPHAASLLPRNLSFQSIGEVFREYVRFPVYTAPYAFAGQAASRATLVILGALTSSSMVGQYALAQRVVFLPISTVMGTASQVFFSRVARKLSDPRLQSAVRWTLVSSALTLGPAFVLAFIYGGTIFRVVFGPNWGQAGKFAVILVAPSMVITMTAWMDRVYDILARQKLALVLEVANNTAALGVMIALLVLTHDAMTGVAGFAVVTVVFYLVWTFITLKLVGVPPVVFGEFVGILAFVVVSLLISAKTIKLMTPNEWVSSGALAALASAYIFMGVRHALRGLRALTPRAGTLQT